MTLERKMTIDNWLGSVLIFLLRPVTYVIGLVLRRDHDAKPRGEIMVLKMLGGGSILLAMPALLGIKKSYPQFRLSILTTRAVKPFAESLGIFDRILVIDDRGAVPLFFSTLVALRRSLGVDTVIDLEVYSKMTTVLSVLICARNRWGFFVEGTFWRKNLHNFLVFFNPFSGVFHFYEEIARLLGASIATTAECRAQLVSSLGVGKGRAKYEVAIGHACSDMGKERMLSPTQWRAVFSRVDFPRHATRIRFFGGPSDFEAASAIIAACSGLNYQFSNECGPGEKPRSLRESLQALGECSEFWGIDSALLHYARLLGLKCRSFWGPTDPRSRLKEDKALIDEVFEYKRIPCSPCIHITGKPPCNGLNLCISGLFEGDQQKRAPLPRYISFTEGHQ